MTDKVVAPVSVPMDLGQVGRAADRLLTKCRKDGADTLETLQHADAQVVLEEEGDELAQDMWNVIRARVERRAKMLVRKVRVDYSRTPRQALDATGRVVGYLDEKVLETAPKTGEGKVEVEGWFFDLDYDPTPVELAREYEVRNLVPDFYWQSAINEADPAFADERPNACQWNLGKDGSASCAAFYRWRDEREVNVNRYDVRWLRRCRFGGVRK